MLTIAVCDDNIQFARTLVSKIRKLCATMVPERILCNVITEFSSADDVIHFVKHNNVDLLFLDIEMPERNGFSLAAELKKFHPDMVIVFVSAHENLVFKSFDYSPLNFLRKSYLERELSHAFSKAIEQCIYTKDTLDFSTTEGEITLRVKDIIYIESQKNYVCIHLCNNTYKCRSTLSQVEQCVMRFDFFRPHAAYLVNLDNIERLTGNSTLIMKNGDIVSISQRRYTEFKNCYSKFIRRRYEK